ncbi:PLP-dependent transferase [Russula earlei]|uniref:PLP-dependent transferase n=1 Tax=Russula earlei TaxID=71964 RepID=A0ACC0UC12_9AGAM|nr:PLP-dependent transferase [Russula earlei]
MRLVLGPKAENAEYLKLYVQTILEDLTQCRRNFSSEDEDFVDAQITSSPAFKKSMSVLRTNLEFLSGLLPQHSVPFYSPRYMAHMVNDVSMPATLGYLMGLMYNPNNISPEAGPLTHIIEYDVGQQLCARNLKYYPLALKRAVDNEPYLAPVAAQFKVRLCTGKEKVLADCKAWDLLNLTPDEVVSLISRLSETLGLSAQAVQAMMKNYLIQTTGKDDLEKYFGIQQPPRYLCPKTKHYSWPKGAAVTGIGSRNIIGVPVDEQARMEWKTLDKLLAESLARRQAVYAVVVIMGTTEHGSVDPLSKVIALRRKYQKRGLSFLIHADAAWGGYFTSMLVPSPHSESRLDDPTFFLNTYVKNELRHLRFADSITIDPHKSGYTPFPAGALCYRDGRLRCLVTWTSPVLGTVEEGATEMGVYGIEGSKPGAAPVAVWLGHEVIGLHKSGFGFLLGQAVFTSMKMYGHWATMSLDHSKLLIVPFRQLPSERIRNASPRKVDEERRFIKDVLLGCTREELAKDPKACALMRQMGSDLVVNSFSCNFLVDGAINQDISEANYLNARIYDRLSLKSMTEKLEDKKIIIMSSVLSQNEYGACLTKFKERLGLRGKEDLYVLVNVSMSLFISPSNFEQVLADAFREVAEEEVEVSVARNRSKPALRTFVLQGSGPRRQCILSGELTDAGLRVYLEAKTADPTSTYLACTLDREDISTIVRRKSFRCLISKLTADGTRAIVEAEVRNIRAIKNRSLCSRHLDIVYPSRMPFYLYGTDEEMHIDHVILRAPNAQVSAGEVTVDIVEGSASVFAAGLKRGLIAVTDTLPEQLMQPFNSDRLKRFFHPGAKYDMSIYIDWKAASTPGPGLCDKPGEAIARATITFGSNTFVDEYMINLDGSIITSQPNKKDNDLPCDRFHFA